MIQTNLFRIKNAIRFKQAFDFDNPVTPLAMYLVFGGADPWTDDNNPDPPDPDTIEIDDAFVAVRATVLLVKEDALGTIIYKDADNVDRKFKQVDDLAEYKTEGSTFVVVTAETTGAIIGTDAFRKLGFVSDLVPVAGHEDDLYLAAANVVDWGDLELLEHRKPVTILEAGSYGGTGILQY